MIEPEEIVSQVASRHGITVHDLASITAGVMEGPAITARREACYLIRAEGWPWKTAAGYSGFSGRSGAFQAAMRHARANNLDPSTLGRLHQWIRARKTLQDCS